MDEKAHFDEKKDNCPIFGQPLKYKMYIIPFLRNIISQFSLNKKIVVML